MSNKQTFFLRRYAWLPRFLKKRGKIFFYYAVSKLSGRRYWKFAGVKLGFITAYHHGVAREMGTDFHEDPPEYFNEWVVDAKDANLIYDIGGYNGLYGIAAALANPHAAVTIFEPDSINAEQCRQNIKLNGVEARCSVSQIAVAGSTGVSTFAMRGMTGGKLGEGETKITCTKLDDLPTPQLIKLDVEGQETAILTNAPKTLSRKPVIFMELHYWAPDKEKLWAALHDFSAKEFDDRHYRLS
ncbi:MAG: FkbM family methyltransferase [bacterium]|nr:FkbM family methyltransferase [bacterium]